MVHVTLRFYADLNAFLPRALRQVAFAQRLRERASVQGAHDRGLQQLIRRLLAP